MKKLDFIAENKTTDLLFNVNAGLMSGMRQERKYGANDDIIPASSPELVRDGGGYLTDYPYLTANAEMYVVSDYALCTATIHILGLVDDGNGNWVEKDVYATLNGTTPVAIGEFIRIFRMRVQECPASAIQGNIYASTLSVGIPIQSQVQAKLNVGEGSTMMAMYTVPSGYTAFIYRLFGSTGKSMDATFSWRLRPYGKVFHTIADATLYQAAQQFEVGYEKVKEKTDIVVMAGTETNNTVVRASFHFVLVDNNFL